MLILVEEHSEGNVIPIDLLGALGGIGGTVRLDPHLHKLLGSWVADLKYDKTVGQLTKRAKLLRFESQFAYKWNDPQVTFP